MALILTCGPLGGVSKKGSEEASSEDTDELAVERDAKEKAARAAFRKALEAAAKYMTVECPSACAQKKIEVTIDAPTTDGAEKGVTAGKWECTAKAGWNLKITCSRKTDAVMGFTLPGTEIAPKPLNCGRLAKRKNKATGEAEAVTPKSGAEKTAKTNAENAAYSQIEQEFKFFTCRKSRCPVRRVKLQIGPPTTTAGPRPTAKDGVWDKNNMFDCSAESRWTMTIECVAAS